VKIEVLVGMIASGKTTYARKRADEGALVVAHDGLSEMLHARYRYEQGLRSVYREMEEALVTVAVQHGRDVVIDRTHLTRESRERWLAFARNLRLTLDAWHNSPPRVIAVSFPIELAEVHARRRFEADPRGRSLDDWMAVAKHHAEQTSLEPLAADEGFDQVAFEYPEARL
jgi:hypothetical protein